MTNKGLTTKTSAIPPNPESYGRAAKQSVSSEKSGADGADPPNAVGSRPPTGDSTREDDIEKLVCVNKDGSLTMEMKVRFRLQNDQTLQWSTKVRKSKSGASDHIQGHKNPPLAQVCDASCSEWENISADDACFTRHGQGHTEEAHCARCCSRCQDQDDSKNAPRTHAARRCVLTSSSSASSITVVSRRTVVERQTVSRSSEEVVEREACVAQSTQAAETVEFCTIQSETCSSKSRRNKSRTAGLHGCTENERDVSTAHGSEHVQAGISAGDEENQNEDGKDVASRASSQMSKPKTKVTTGGKMLDTGSTHVSTVSLDKTSNQAGRSRKTKTSKPSHACHCGASANPQDETRGQVETRAEEEGELERAQSSSMSVKSHTSYKEGKMGSKSAAVQSNASTQCNSDGLEDAAEQIQTGDDNETRARPSSCASVTSVKSGEAVEVKRPLSSVSAKSKASARSRRSHRSCAASEKQAEEDLEQRTPSVMSAFSNVSAELKHIACEASEEESSQHSDEAEENADEPEVSVQSAKSDRFNGSGKSRSSEVRVTESADVSDKVSSKRVSEQRSQSVQSNMSAKSNKSKNTAVLSSGSGDRTTDGSTGAQSEEKDLDKEDVSDEGRGPSVLSVKSAKSTFSNTSAKSNPSKPNDVSAAGHADQRERAPSNMSAASVRSSRSDTSAACVPTDVWEDASEETVAEGERKSVSSVSVLSDKSNISSRSKYSAPSPAAEGPEILRGDNEKVKREKRAERASSALSAKSTSSRKSTKSTKSNTAKVHLSVNPDEPKDEDENQEQAQSAMSAKTIESINSARSARSKRSADAPQEKNSEAPDDGQDDREQSEERAPSSTSAKTVHSQVSADRPQTASSGQSAKSTAPADVQTPATAEMLNGAEETAFRTSTKSKTCGPADKNRSNHEERVERAQSNMSGRSEKSTKSNVSRASKRLEVAAVCLEEELHNPNQRAAEGERDENNFRPTSPQSDDSDISLRTNKSNCTTDALLEDDAKTTDEEIDEEREERPPSSVSAKSVQSSVSEISVKSAERTRSALSTKSAKSAKSAQTNISVCSGRRPAEGNDAEEAHERAPSAPSAKTTKSTNSVKSTRTKKLDDPAENNATGQNDDAERAQSGSSVRSGKSTVSNVSSVSKRNRAAGACWEDEGEEETAEEQGEDECTSSPQSVVSNRSGRSNKSTSFTDAPVKERPDVPNKGTERAESSMSTTSSRSCVSEASVKSAKSNASALSVKTNISDAQCGKPSAPPDEADSEDEEGTHSVVSVKSTNAMISDKSVQSAGPNDKNHTDRSPSNPSEETEASPESNVSAASEGSHMFTVQDSFNRSDVRAAEGETNERGISLASPQSDRLQSPAKESSEITDDGNNTEQSENRTLSSMSAKSVQSRASGRSATSARSAKSTKSAKSVKTDVSVPSGATSQNPEKDDENETLQRTHSALSAKTTTSTHSTASTKLKAKGDISDDEGREDKSSSNMSTRSARSSKSTVSTLSQISKASGVPCEPNTERVHEENPQEDEEDIESGSMSSMSIHSAKTDVSSRSNRSKCSIHVAAEENARPKSSSTQVLSASNTPEGEHDEQSTQGRSESAVSAKSRNSAKSNRSKVLAAPAAESPLELDCEERPESNETIKSNVSARPDAAAAQCSESPNEDCGEETAEGRSASCTSVKTSLSHASGRSLKSHTSATASAPSTSSAKDHEIHAEESTSHSEEKPGRTPSVMSVKTNVSVKSKKSNVFDGQVKESATYKEERTVSPVSVKSNLSDVPAVTVEESEDRSPTAISTKSKTCSKKSKTPEVQGKKRDEKSQSSLSVRSHLSVKSKISTRTDISTASISSKTARQRVGGAISPSLQKKDKEDTTDKDSFNTVKSRGEGTEETRAEVTVENSTASQIAKAGTQPVIRHAESSESDLSQTLSTSDNIKEIRETSTPEELVSKRIAKDQLEAKDKEGSDTNKSDKSCKFGQKHKDPDDFGLVTSILPCSSPTEVVNEWLKRLPEEGDIYNLEELNEDCDGPKSHAVVEESQKAGDSDKTVESEAEISKTKDEENMMNVQSNDCQMSTDAKQEDNSCTQRESGSKMINPSIQVMKVLLNPKLDRCNSLPEISPVYGRKLSTSAKGLLDCLVKLQLIDHKSKIANEKDKRYQELMRILQSLWLADPPASEGAQNNKNEHRSVDEEYNHTSSSGVDVNSGSTGSGKSSDGVKSSNDFNGLKVQEEAKDQWPSERVDVKQEDESPGTDKTIRNNDSPREPPETPSPSNKTSGDSSSNGQKLGEEAETESQEDSPQSPTLSHKAQLDKMQSQDLDPVWVLTLLTKIEKQFMTHYTSAMQEFKVRLNLDDGDQLDAMIAELKTEIQQRIQTSIDREVKRIQSRAGLPRPPKEASPRVSTLKSERRQRRKIKLQQSMESQAGKSDDSASGTGYSDQRNENIDECCPCDTCTKEEMTSSLALAAIVRSTAPVNMDSDFMQMKTGGSVNAQTPVSCASQSKNGHKATAGERTSDEDAALEEDTCVAITPGGEFKIESEVDQNMSNKEDKNEETTVNASSEHTTDKKEHVTIGQRDKTEKTLSDELSNRTNQVDYYETEELVNVEVPCKNELKEEEMETSVEEASVTQQGADIEKTRKKWTVKKTLLPTLRIALGRKDKSMYSEENDTAVFNENIKEAVDRSESTRETAAEGQTKTSSDDESGKETAGGTTDEDEDDAEEDDEATTSECKSNKEENEETNTDDDVSSEEEILETASNAGDEKAIETSTAVTGEHATEEDDAVERTTVTALNDQESDTDTAGEKTGTTSEDEPEDDVRNHKLSSESVEEPTADESVVEETAATRKDRAETTPVEVENVEGSFTRSQREHTSEQETSVEDSVVSEEEATPTSGKASPDGNGDSATDDSSEEPDETATDTKKAVENQNADSGDEESMNKTAKEEDASVVSSTARESDDEEAVEIGNSDAGEENGAGEKTYAAEPLKCSSEDEADAPETSVATERDCESEKDASESDGAVPDVEKLPDTENTDSASADASSEESSEEGATDDDEAGLNGSAVSQKDESKDGSTEGETSEETDKEAAAEAATDDDDDEEETSAASEEEEKDASTNEDESAENDDVVNGELKQAEEEDTEDEQAVEETTTDEDEDVTTMTVTSPHISTGEELVNFEDKPAIAKKPDLDVISETDNEEEGSGNDPAEDGADEDSGEDPDAFPTETSSTEKKEQIEKAYNESNENEQEERTDGDKPDVCDNTETDPGSTREESLKAASGTESDEERDPSDELAGREEAPSVKTNDSGEDSEARPEPGTGEEAARAATDENDTPSEDEHVEGAEELDEKESCEENAKDFQEEEQSDTLKNQGPAEDETPGDESEDERESEIKCDARQNETQGSKHPEAEEDEVTKSDEEEELRAEDGSKGEVAEREEADKADDETAQETRLGADRDVAAGRESDSDKIKHSREDDDTSDERQETKRSSLDNDQETAAEESEKEGEEPETLDGDWSGNQGASADGGDEAEEDSDQPEEAEAEDGAQPFVISNTDVSAASNQETTLMPLDALNKRRDESEDGAYADVEDSETEINSQEEEMSLKSTSLKHRCL